MEPISTLLMAGAGLGFQAVGMFNSVSAASQQSEAQMRSIALQQKVEAQRQKAMELDARRKQMELLRNAQKARALALTNATSQGAGQGSGLQGGYGQISGDAGNTLGGINQNLDIGRSIFGLNSQISQENLNLAKAGQQAALGQGLSSFGGSLINSAGTFGKLASGFGKGPSGPTGDSSYFQPGGMGYIG